MNMQRYNELFETWHRLNDHGQGYSPEGKDINRLTFAELVIESLCFDELAIYRLDDGTLVGVGNANGLWAIDFGVTE